MLAILQFIFSSFWIWLGTLILVAAICSGLRPLFSFQWTDAFRKKKKEAECSSE